MPSRPDDWPDINPVNADGQPPEILTRTRRCWIRKDNLQLSSEADIWEEPCWTALVLEYVRVRSDLRRQGIFSRFLEQFIREPAIELFVVEMVQNPYLADALTRRGWSHDPDVMDFYLFTTKPEPT